MPAQLVKRDKLTINKSSNRESSAYIFYNNNKIATAITVAVAVFGVQQQQLVLLLLSNVFLRLVTTFPMILACCWPVCVCFFIYTSVRRDVVVIVTRFV